MANSKQRNGHRFIGYVMIALAAISLVLCVVGIVFGFRLIDQIGVRLDESLTLATASLERVETDLGQVKATLGSVSAGMVAAADTVRGAGDVIDATGPLLEGVSETVSKVAVNGVDSLNEPIQEVLGGLSDAASSVDTLTRSVSQLGGLLGVSEMEISTNIEEPIAETSAQIDDIASSVREIDQSLVETTAKVENLGQETQTLADSLDAIAEDVAAFIPSMDEYIAIINEVQTGLSDLQTDLQGGLGTLKIVVVILMLWIAVWQIIPAYLGWDILRGGKEEEQAAQPPAMEVDEVGDGDSKQTE